MQRSPRSLGRPRKEQNGQSTKDKILYIATELFLEKGYSAVSMDDVAQKCDVTKATVYYYYKTKADLFTDAMVQLMIRIKRQITEMLSTTEPLKTQLFKLANAHLQATVDIDIHSFMKEAKISLSAEQLQWMKKSEDEMYSALESALKKAMDRGEIPHSDARLNAILFVAMLAAGNNMDGDSKESFQSLNDLVTQIMNVFWNGIS